MPRVRRYPHDFPHGDKMPENLWRIEQFATWLGVRPRCIYGHIHEGTLNPKCYRYFGRYLVFLPQLCAELLYNNELLIRRTPI